MQFTMLKKLFDKINSHKEEQTLELLFKWFGKTVYLAAYGILKDHYLAEEITQDTFVAAYQNMDQLQDVNKIQAWLVRIAINKSYDLLKNRKRIVALEHVSVAGTCKTPESELINQEQQKEIQLAIEELAPKYQEIIFLKYYTEMTTKQIAQATEIPEGTVKSRLRKAHSLIARLLNKSSQTGGEVSGPKK